MRCYLNVSTKDNEGLVLEITTLSYEYLSQHTHYHLKLSLQGTEILSSR